MVAETVPDQVIAGDTWRWTRSLADYPATTWTLTYYFENADDTFSAVASPSGSDHAVTIAAATTAGKKAGRYRWFARASSGGILETVEQGWVEVLPDPAAEGKRDHRSWARRTLDALEATLEGRASQDQLAMTINGRSISRMPISELRQWRAELRTEVQQQEQGDNAGLGRNLKVRLL